MKESIMILYKEYTVSDMLMSTNPSLKVEGHNLIAIGFPQTATFQVILKQVLK